jgi:predicted Zn-dependent protease
MNSEAELAGVLGHEIGHVTARHSVSQISKSQLFGLGLGLGSVLSPTFGRYSQLAQSGVGILFLKYGRDDEREADQLGVEYMYELDYDPRELSGFFEVFQSMREEQGGGVPDWLSTHPSPPDRIEATRAKANALISEYGEKDFRLGAEDFLKKIEGTVFGENPREGFTQDGFFYHPDMKFQMDYPDGWQVINTRVAVVFLESSQQAAMQLTLVPPDVTSPRARAEQISNQQGVRMLESGPRDINGNPAFLAIYQVSDYSGNSLQALAAFIDYGENIYQLVGSAPPNRFRQYYASLENMVNSFRELRDRKILSVQPDRIRLYRVRRGGTLQDIAKRYPNERVGVKELSVINRIDEGKRLGAGTLVKVVEAGR